MKTESRIETPDQLCEQVRRLINDHQIEAARQTICEAMMEYPDAAQPHNLMGILLEKQGSHASAMKHFRAAAALDPAFSPSVWNMEKYGSYSMLKEEAYTQADCAEPKKRPVKLKLMRTA